MNKTTDELLKILISKGDMHRQIFAAGAIFFAGDTPSE